MSDEAKGRPAGAGQHAGFVTALRGGAGAGGGRYTLLQVTHHGTWLIPAPEVSGVPS